MHETLSRVLCCYVGMVGRSLLVGGAVTVLWLALFYSSCSFDPKKTTTAERKKKKKKMSSHPTRIASSLREEHPGCFSKGFGIRQAVSEHGRYIKIGQDGPETITRPVRYTHLCKFMKPRYNCAKNETALASLNYGDVATDWKFVFRQNKTTSEKFTCNLWEFVSSLGGPRGLGKYLLSKKKKKTTVLLAGNSHLRQIFSALVCGFEDDVTDFRLLLKAPGFDTSLESLKKRGINPYENEAKPNEKKFTTAEAGRLERPPDGVDGRGTCVTPSKPSPFYVQHVTQPDACYYDDPELQGPNNVGRRWLNSYSSDLAMVEFGGGIRFYYAFNPWNYANITDVFRTVLKLDPWEVDALVFNRGTRGVFQEEAPDLFGAFQATGAWRSRRINEWPMPLFKRVQKKDIGRQFYPDNPGITGRDGHSCMPGMPDDEANMLLLWMLLQQGE